MFEDPAVLVAALALIGTIATAYFQYRTTVKQEKSAREKTAEEEAELQKVKTEEAETKLHQQELKTELATISAQVTTLADKLNSTHNETRRVQERIDSVQDKLSVRIQAIEESVNKITNLISRYSRQHSAASMMNRKTAEQMQQMIRMETYNLTFTKQVADLLDSLTELIMELHPDDSEYHEKLQKIVAQIEGVKNDFLNSMMMDNVKSFGMHGTASQDDPDDDTDSV